VKLRFEDDVEAFRHEFRHWLGDNAPSVKERLAEPALGSASLPA
jgi:hypothetical protein